jgi:chaperone modulatory protein CbpM
MIISKVDFLQRAQLDCETFGVWIQEGWLIPTGTADGEVLSEMDLARARLIRDLKNDLGVNDEGVGVILHLLDQIHGLRRTLEDLLQSARESSVPADDPSSADQDQGRK